MGAGPVAAVEGEEPGIELLKADVAPRTIQALAEDPFTPFPVYEIDGTFSEREPLVHLLP